MQMAYTEAALLMKALRMDDCQRLPDYNSSDCPAPVQRGTIPAGLRDMVDTADFPGLDIREDTRDTASHQGRAGSSSRHLAVAVRYQLITVP